MKNEKYYFKDKDSELCYPKSYLMEQIKNNNVSAINVYAAEKIKVTGIFWCTKNGFSGDNTSEVCGINNCDDYAPRNGKNGCCRHHSSTLYELGEKITLQLEK